MPSLSVILKLFLTILAARAQASSEPREEVYTSKSESSSKTVDPRTIQTLPHDAVVPMRQLIPPNMDGQLYLAYQPRLKVLSGCVPFPAVDEEGKIGRGLHPSGNRGGGGSKCSRSVGQVYVRSTPVGKWFALLYTWYEPKDQTGMRSGSRHDFEGVVVLLRNRNATDAANIYAVCPSARGEFRGIGLGPPPNPWTCTVNFQVDGTFPLIKYGNGKHHKGENQDHTCTLTNLIGEHHPLVAWESMPEAAVSALSNYDYGKVQVPFIDKHFNATLAQADPPPEILHTIDHNRVIPMPQLTPDGINGTLYLTYQPQLKVLHGCVPFPVVDIWGKISRGLNPSGPSGKRGSKCGGSVGQVYVRSARAGKYFALLYSWFQPKDQRGSIGKRYDFEGVIIYLRSPDDTDASNVYVVCPSAQGKWTCSTKFSLDGTSPLIAYKTAHDSADNSCFLSNRAGKKQPLVAWESMPLVAAEALSQYDFGETKVPFIDAHFNATLALAVPPA